MRIAPLFILLFSTLTMTAQMPGGPLTITRSISTRPAHAPVQAHRGTGAPYNDLCQNVIVHTLPSDGSVSITGDNTGATDTEDFGNPVCWEAFTIDTCATVTVSYCGTDPLFELVYSILIVGCPDFIANVQNNGTTACDDGNTVITYEALAAGTYYVPVLSTAGAEGAYTMTVTSDVCDTPPLNDICANATMLAVVQDCALGMVMGNNANTVVNSTPSCVTTTTQFQDVWYQFDSGEHDEVVIKLAPGTIGDIGLEVRDGCSGVAVFCATGDTSYTIPVDPGTNYRVRIFSNNDFGFGGTFGICVTLPQGECAAGALSVIGGATSVSACTNGGDPIVFALDGASGNATALVLTDAEDTIITVLPGFNLMPDGMVPGDYHVWAFAFDSDLLGAEPDSILSGITATGNCLDVGDSPVTVTIEICQGIEGASTNGPNFVLLTNLDGVWLRWSGGQERIRCELFDARGSLISREMLVASPGLVECVTPSGRPAPGAYVLRVTGEGDPPMVERVFVH
ncbi:MAG: hypothetical protein KA791_11530 [Flavobacteriales bacterium]|nr:hypothetical protein [Flavobacteriales bacterium]